MLSKSLLLSVFASLLALSAAHPIHSSSFAAREVRYGSGSLRRALPNPADDSAFPEIQKLIQGNQKFQKDIEAISPGLLKALTDDGQAPPFMYIGCSDSRVSENTIFSALPGTLFVQRNIANQYVIGDINSESAVAYSIKVLGIKHVIVLGHYGCGGIAAAIASPPDAFVEPVDATDNIVQAWIQPIRELFQTSSRPEIVALREKNAKLAGPVPEPEVEEPGFRALVEENVKVQVKKIAESHVMANAARKFADFEKSGGKKKEGEKAKRGEGVDPVPVIVHGWVYDIANGQIKDLKISEGFKSGKAEGAKGEPKKGEPMEQPKKEEPKKEEPKKEEPKKEEPKKEEPKKEEPKTEEPKKEEPKKAEPPKEPVKAPEPAKPVAADPKPTGSKIIGSHFIDAPKP